MTTANFYWLEAFPQCPEQNYSESIKDNVIRSDMDAGIQKQRQRYTRLQTMLSLSYLMTDVQKINFMLFMRDLSGGASPFYLPKPTMTYDVAAAMKNVQYNKTSNEYFVVYLYQLFGQRYPSTSEISTWVTNINGSSRLSVFQIWANQYDNYDNVIIVRTTGAINGPTFVTKNLWRVQFEVEILP